MKKHIICINGTLCTEDLWHHQVAHLSDSYTFSIPKIMGIDNIDDIAQDILKTAPDCFIMAGMSAGVPIALAVVRQLIAHNQLPRLEKIILIAGNPNGVSDTKQQHFESQQQFVTEHGLETYAKTILTQYIGDCHKNNTDITQKIIDMAMDFTPVEFHKHTDMLKSRPCSINTLKHICCPLLAISGMDDNLCTSSMHETMAKLAKNGMHIALKNTGHYINLENPLALNTHLRHFLKP